MKGNFSDDLKFSKASKDLRNIEKALLNKANAALVNKILFSKQLGLSVVGLVGNNRSKKLKLKKVLMEFSYFATAHCSFLPK